MRTIFRPKVRCHELKVVLPQLFRKFPANWPHFARHDRWVSSRLGFSDTRLSHVYVRPELHTEQGYISKHPNNESLVVNLGGLMPQVCHLTYRLTGWALIDWQGGCWPLLSSFPWPSYSYNLKQPRVQAGQDISPLPTERSHIY